MKKIMFAVSAITVLALASCKKDYSCECVTKDGSTTMGTSTSTINANKKDAEAACTGLNASSGTLSTTCTIK